MRELLVFRQQVFRHLRQDWTDVIARARDLWSPKSRTRDCYTGFESQVALGAAADSSSGSGSGSGVSSSGTGTGCKSTGTPSSPSSAPAVSDSDDVPVVVEDQDRGEWIPSLWLPGRVLHLYSHAGRYKAVKVSRALPTLRRIEIQGNIFTDHASQTIFDALLEVCCLFRSLLTALAKLALALIQSSNSIQFSMCFLWCLCRSVLCGPVISPTGTLAVSLSMAVKGQRLLSAVVVPLLLGLLMTHPRSVLAVSVRSLGTAPSRARLRSTGRGTTAGTAEGWSVDRALS
jgi:hypothetical protein